MPARLCHFLIFTTILSLFFTSCGTVRNLIPKKKAKESKEEEKANKDTYIGVIEMVNPEQKFVLIRTNARFTLPTGTKLHTLSSAGLKSVLKISPEHKPNLLSADIVEGYPMKGQAAFIPYDPEAAAAVGTQDSPTSSLPPGLPNISIPTPAQVSQELSAPEDDPTPGVLPGQKGPAPSPRPSSFPTSPEDPIPGVPPTDLPPAIP